MRSRKNRLIEIREAAALVGSKLFGENWTGEELAKDALESSAVDRATQVKRYLREMIRDGSVKTWTVDERGDRWPISTEIATHHAFGISLIAGRVGGMWGPDSESSGCVFDRTDFNEYTGISRPKHAGGRPAKHSWEDINNQIWKRIYFEGTESNATLSKEVLDWCGENFAEIPDPSEVRKRVTKILKLIKDGN